MDWSPPDRRASIKAVSSYAPCAATLLAKTEREVSPTRRIIRKMNGNKRGNAYKHLCCPNGQGTLPLCLLWVHYTHGPTHTISSTDSSCHVVVHVVHMGSRGSATYRLGAMSTLRFRAYIKPFFVIFFKEINSEIYLKNQNKIQKIYKIQKFIFSFLELLFYSSFLHWMTNFLIFNIMPPKI